MYSAIHSLPLDLDGAGMNHGEFHGGALDACVVLTTDPKPRLRWTSELHDRFIDAVTQLGGPDKATPKTLLRTMGVKGLTLYHLKSHLQKYRLGKLSCKESTCNSKDASCIAECQDTGSSSPSSSRLMTQDLNDAHQVTEALRVQMDVQRRLQEQLEVQRRVQIRIEAQGKYFQSILEKACKALSEQAAAIVGLEATTENLSDLAINIDNFRNPTLSEIANIVPNVPARIGDCSFDSCLTSIGSPISPSVAILGSQTAAGMKKRARPLFGNGDLSTLESGWMMTNIG